jgi:type II secretory pathway pseudopilin PulG
MSGRVSLSDSRGFTLMELVVAMSLGIVVLLAAFTVIDRSWSASKKVSDREDALQRGRIALELMTRELHSMTCAGQTAPVAVAKDNEVDFYAYMGDPTSGGSTNPDLHKVVYGTSSNGTITDSAYAVTDMTTTPPTVSGTASYSRRLLANVGQISTTPFFSYYTFDPSAAQGSGTFLQLSTNGGTGLTSTDLAKVVKVAINFKSLPTGNVVNPPTTNFQDDVFWRAVDPESPNSQPCTQGT